MKPILYLLTAVIFFTACKSSDKKTNPNALTKEQRDQAMRDSTNFTTITWLDSTYLDLGKVKEGKLVEVSYRFKNTGDKPLIIGNVSASCGCTVPEKPEEAFPPGKEGEIKAKFDSKGRPHGENRKEVYVTANTRPPVHELTFRVEITD